MVSVVANPFLYLYKDTQRVALRVPLFSLRLYLSGVVSFFVVLLCISMNWQFSCSCHIIREREKRREKYLTMSSVIL